MSYQAILQYIVDVNAEGVPISVRKRHESVRSHGGKKQVSHPIGYIQKMSTRTNKVLMTALKSQVFNNDDGDNDRSQRAPFYFNARLTTVFSISVIRSKKFLRILTNKSKNLG